MQFTPLTRVEQVTAIAKLAEMPDILHAAFGTLSASDAQVPGPEAAFSPVEQCWHLADVEREAYATRIRRLLTEAAPFLPDFDGASVAEERRYRMLSLAEGLCLFREARLANLETLRALAPHQWSRSGIQEGLGTIALCDVPAMMAAHDESHRREIAAWRQAHDTRRRTRPGT